MRFLALIIVLLVSSVYATEVAQDSEFFRAKLGEPSKVIDENSEVYEQKNGISVRIGYDEEGQACSINIYALPVDRGNFQRLVAVANELVPLSTRGTIVGTTREIGNCTDLDFEDYERAFVIYNQNACYDQGVAILLKKSSCPKPPLVPALNRSFSVRRTPATCAAAPSKSRLEGIIGSFSPAYPGLDGYFPITTNNTLVLFKYGGAYQLEDLIIKGTDGIAQITRLLEKIVPQNNRGKFLQRDAAKIRRVRGETYFEKYECLSIEYSEEYGPENSGYASVRVLWNNGQRN
jgi:hypothetical protein